MSLADNTVMISQFAEELESENAAHACMAAGAIIAIEQGLKLEDLLSTFQHNYDTLKEAKPVAAFGSGALQ